MQKRLIVFTKARCCTIEPGKREYYALPERDYIPFLSSLVGKYGGDNCGLLLVDCRQEAADLSPAAADKYVGKFPAWLICNKGRDVLLDASDPEAILEEVLSQDWGDWTIRLVEQTDLPADWL